MTIDATLPEPLEMHEVDALVPSYWGEPEFADWRVQGACDPGWDVPLPAGPPIEAVEEQDLRDLVDSIDFLEMVAAFDWDVTHVDLDRLDRTGS